MRIWGDFNDVDAEGRVVLSWPDDVKTEAIQLKEGMRVVIWDQDLEAEGVLEFEEGKWRARLVAGSGRSREAPNRTRN